MYRLDIFKVIDGTNSWPKIDSVIGVTEQNCLDKANERYDADEHHWTNPYEAANVEHGSISVNNGLSYTTPVLAIEKIGWDVIVNSMEDDIREWVHNQYAPCTNEKFLEEYLDCGVDLVIG